jgi:SH3-like domain-containing protein
MFFILAIIFVLRNKLNLAGTLTSASLPCLIILTSVSCIISQVFTTYNKNNVIVIEKSLELRSLPALNSGRVIAVIPGGNAGKVIEYRDNYARIQVNGQDGWTPKKNIESIFPGSIF